MPALPTCFAVAAAISFAPLTKPILVQTRTAQFRAHLPSRRSSPAYLAVAAAIPFTSFAQLTFHLAGAAQLLALSTAPFNSDASRPDLNRLGGSRNGKNKNYNGSSHHKCRSLRRLLRLAHRSARSPGGAMLFPGRFIAGGMIYGALPRDLPRLASHRDGAPSWPRGRVNSNGMTAGGLLRRSRGLPRRPGQSGRRYEEPARSDPQRYRGERAGGGRRREKTHAQQWL